MHRELKHYSTGMRQPMMGPNNESFGLELSIVRLYNTISSHQSGDEDSLCTRKQSSNGRHHAMYGHIPYHPKHGS